MNEKEEWPSEPTRLTDDEVDTLARRMITNEVYFTNSEEGMKNSFSLILTFADIPRSFTEKVGGMYEDYSKASERGINGYPFFFSAHFLHLDDLPLLGEKVKAKEEALAS